MTNPKTDFYIMFLKDPSTGVIFGNASRNNAVADYKRNPYFIGYQKVAIDINNLQGDRNAS